MTQDLQNRITALEEALRPFGEAYKRMRLYGEQPSDDANLYAEDGDCLYELLHANETRSVKVGHLADAASVLGL